jgi:hypothetical protein
LTSSAWRKISAALLLYWSLLVMDAVRIMDLTASRRCMPQSALWSVPVRLPYLVLKSLAKMSRGILPVQSGEVYRERKSSKHSLQVVSSKGRPLVEITLTRSLESIRAIYAVQAQPHALRVLLLSISIGHSPTVLKREISYHDCCSSCLRD